MDTIRIMLDLPADFVQDAESFDLLDPKSLEHLLREELDRRIMALVNNEVKIYRQQKRDIKDNRPSTQFLEQASPTEGTTPE